MKTRSTPPTGRLVRVAIHALFTSLVFDESYDTIILEKGSRAMRLQNLRRDRLYDTIYDDIRFNELFGFNVGNLNEIENSIGSLIRNPETTSLKGRSTLNSTDSA